MSEVRLKRLFRSVSGGSWGTEPEEGEVTLPCIRGTDFDYPALRSTIATSPIRGFSRHEVARRAAQRGDLIIEKSGGGEKQPVGRVVLHDFDDLVMPTNFASRLTPTEANESRFLTYLMSSLYAVGSTKSSIKQTTGIQNLDVQSFLDTVIFQPSLPEQRAIVDFLDAETARIDALIEKKRRMHSVIEERFRSERDQRIRRLMADHGSTTVRRLVDGVEQGWSPSCENVEADPNEWGVLKTSAVTQGIFKGTENKRLPDDLQPDLRWTVKDGDVLVARGSGSLERVGTAAVAATEERNLMISDLIYRLVSPRMNSTLLAHCLNSSIGRTHLESSIRTDVGQTLKIRGDDLLDTPIPGVASKLQAPALEEIERRRRIANETIERLSAQLELLTEHRQALITAAVTGQMEVTRSQQLGEPR